MNRYDDTIASMADRIAALESHLSKVESNLKAAQRRGRNAWIASGVILFSAIMLAANPQVQAQFGITLASLNTRLTAVENKTAPLSYNSTTKLLTVSGANVMIVDGTGSTESSSGLGNLQVGYNALRGDGDVRSGSHNLILGDQQNYSKSGGLVAGFNNSISGLYATVSGGASNTASGDYASVSGGLSNVASGNAASVSGGQDNKATFPYTSISGGIFNTAMNFYASISGGVSNTVSGNAASVSGGILNTASGNASSVLGGNSINLNTLYGTYPAGP